MFFIFINEIHFPKAFPFEGKVAAKQPDEV